jgi:OOP family OmpA-OmpF porin
MSLKKALLAATVLALPITAQAQPVSGLYVGAGAGVNWLQESDVTFNGGGGTASVDFSIGWVGVISLGYGFGNGVRAEIEGNYRQNDADTVSGGGRSTAASGRVASYGVMANALYDFDLGPGMPIVPYIGVGAGYVWSDWDNVRPAGGGAAVDGSNGQFAYQAIVGAALPLNDFVPGLSLTAEYRFLGTLSPEIDVRGGGTAEVDSFNHSLMIGLRYAFNQPAPPPAVVAPAPAAAPAPARTFLVFFDFDRADLTDRARAIIAEAATNAGRVGTTRIEVAGHADRAGTPQYNQALSQRRAAAVAAELERRGVARSAMTIQAFGESRPLVPTADGVREPQNRRVEIVLR